MAGRLRDYLNSFLNAPSKPSSRTSQEGAGRQGSLKATLNRWISGPASSDPLYLSNRTFSQKARVWLVIGVPFLVVAAVLVNLSLNGYFSRSQAPAPPPPDLKTIAEAEQKRLPNLENLHVAKMGSLEVVEVKVTRGDGALLRGKVRNNGDRTIRSAEVVFYLTDISGSDLGAVSVHLKDVRAKDTFAFQQLIEPKVAYGAILREVHSQ